MSCTRLRNDPARLMKEADIFSFPGRYSLDVPGQGVDLPFIEDPHFRLSKWGANAMTNMVDIENDLRCMTKPNVNYEEYQKYAPMASKLSFQDERRALSDESRSTHPAFQYVEKEMVRWEEPFINPQSNIEIPCQYNIQTRMLEKDYFQGGEQNGHVPHSFNPHDWLPARYPQGSSL